MQNFNPNFQSEVTSEVASTSDQPSNDVARFNAASLPTVTIKEFKNFDSQLANSEFKKNFVSGVYETKIWNFFLAQPTKFGGTIVELW